MPAVYHRYPRTDHRNANAWIRKNMSRPRRARSGCAFAIHRYVPNLEPPNQRRPLIHQREKPRRGTPQKTKQSTPTKQSAQVQFAQVQAPVSRVVRLLLGRPRPRRVGFAPSRPTKPSTPTQTRPHPEQESKARTFPTKSINIMDS
jgi:hypothetical protein